MPRVLRHSTLLLLRFEPLVRQFAFSNRWYRSPHELRVDSAEDFVVHLVAVVLNCDRLVLEGHGVLLNAVLLQEFKERLVSEHLGDFELVLVPVLRQTGLDVRLLHVEELPVHSRASFAHKCSEGHVKVRALLLAAVDTEGVECIFDQDAIDELSLFWDRALAD